MRLITRERPKIDRIACPWLIKQFVDPEAEFIYMTKEKVIEEAQRLDAIPYDIAGVEYTHYGGKKMMQSCAHLSHVIPLRLDRLIMQRNNA